MNTELMVLFANGVLTFFILFIQGIQVPLNFGFKFGLGNRDSKIEPTVFMLRCQRTLQNQIEALALFLPVILTILLLPNASNETTAMGAVIFLVGRVGFVLSYLIGVPVFRSVIWLVGTSGWLILVFSVSNTLMQ